MFFEGILVGFFMKDYLVECVCLKSLFEVIGGLEVWFIDIYFMLVCLCFGKVVVLKEYLVCEEGILIWDVFNFEGLDECFFCIVI